MEGVRGRGRGRGRGESMEGVVKLVRGRGRGLASEENMEGVVTLIRGRGRGYILRINAMNITTDDPRPRPRGLLTSVHPSGGLEQTQTQTQTQTFYCNVCMETLNIEHQGRIPDVTVITPTFRWDETWNAICIDCANRYFHHTTHNTTHITDDPGPNVAAPFGPGEALTSENYFF